MDTGLRAAAAASGPDDVIVTMDADLTHDPRFAVRMLDRYRQGCDVVIASRFRHGSLEIGVSRFRLFMTRGARLLFGSLVPVEGVRDYSCGYRLYRSGVISEAYERLGDDFVTERGFACMVEIIGKLRRLARCCEVPFVLHYEEKRSASQMRIVPTVAAYLRVVSKIWVLDRSGRLGEPVRPSGEAYAALAGAVLLAVLGQTLLKIGVGGLGGAPAAGAIVAALLSVPVLAGVVCYGTSAVLWLAVLTRMRLSIAYPLGAASYLLVLPVASALGETVPVLRWAGVIVIIVGIALVGAGFESRGQGEDR
jgi:multidrug transporter EmrE-like cation transporter